MNRRIQSRYASSVRKLYRRARIKARTRSSNFGLPESWFGVASSQRRSTTKIDMNKKHNPELGEQLFMTFYERSFTSR
jgi:hypothetical protein